MDNLDIKQKAWTLAHQLICLGKIVKKEEQMDMIHISTSEIAKVLGKPDEATMEEIKEFVYLVIEYMKGYGMSISCGCGYLFIRVATEETMDQLMESDRDITIFTPEDLQSYFNEKVLNITPESKPLNATCDVHEIKNTLSNI